MIPNGKTSRSGAATNEFWNFVPDPTRTIFYLLVGLMVCVAAEWIPELAGQIEQTRMQQRMRETKERELAAYAAWRRQYPHYDLALDETLAQETVPAESETESDYQLAQPSAPMSPMNSESTTPATWN